MELPASFIDYTRALLGDEEYDKLAVALQQEPPVSIRLNQLKINHSLSDKVPWSSEGFYLEERLTFTFDPLFHAGCYYVQEASSMFVEQVLRQYITGPVKMLDLCAAPGGKSTHARSVLPEGTWIDYNNKQTIYTGEQWTTVDAPLSSVPMFVKQGSIIPTMPVMNYTHEKPVYPLTFEIFPAQEGAQAAFTLYEDEGEDLGYQRDEFVKTPIICSTLANGYELTVSAREGKGYTVPGPRNLLFRIYSAKAPKEVTVKGKKIKKTKPERLEENLENDTETVVWSWDKETGVCSVRMPDKGGNEQIMIAFK